MFMLLERGIRMGYVKGIASRVYFASHNGNVVLIFRFLFLLLAGFAYESCFIC